ncbi:MAG: hypothetical protein AABX53_00775 [Nanoarchaeota archaeon]
MNSHHERVVLEETGNRSTFLRWASDAVHELSASRGGLTGVVIQGEIAKVRTEVMRDVYKGTLWFPYRARPDNCVEVYKYTLGDIIDDRDPREPFSVGKEVQDQLYVLLESLRAYGPLGCIPSIICSGASSELHLQRR